METRKYGYGGYNYKTKYWTEVVKDFVGYYKLDKKARILDVFSKKDSCFMILKTISKHINSWNRYIKYAIKKFFY